MVSRLFTLVLLLFVPTLGGAGDNHSPLEEIRIQKILETEKTIVGQDIEYPFGKAKVTMAIVTVPAGQKTAIHIHEVPLVGYVLEGALTVDYGSKGTVHFPAGSAIVEAVEWPHAGRNDGDIAVKILAVYLGNRVLENAVGVEALE